jgi:hypothetical protein
MPISCRRSKSGYFRMSTASHCSIHKCVLLFYCALLYLFCRNDGCCIIKCRKRLLNLFGLPLVTLFWSNLFGSLLRPVSLPSQQHLAYTSYTDVPVGQQRCHKPYPFLLRTVQIVPTATYLYRYPYWSGKTTGKSLTQNLVFVGKFGK